jgi:predicted ferric reductase
LSLGRLLLLAGYTNLTLFLLISVDAPISTSHFVDDLGFRSAWISIVQIPIIFLLSTKRGGISTINISYDRINWVHKWIGRMLMVSATTHVAIMKSSISMQDIIMSQDKGATVVLYGMGAYVSLVWITLTSVLPLRKWSYRAFYINHWISTLLFLIIIFQHVPKHARAPVYLAFGIVALDKLISIVSFLRTNISVRTLENDYVRFGRTSRAVLVKGYPVEFMEPHITSVSAHTEDTVVTLRVLNVPFSWKPGQHVRLYIPALGLCEMHPFTPVNCSDASPPPPLPPRRGRDVESANFISSLSAPSRSSEMVLMVRPYSGLTRRLAEYHSEWLSLPCPNASLPSTTLTAYLDGPYGSPPSWQDYESIILVATSTGVSFILSIMDCLEQLCFSNSSQLKTRTVRFIWVVRHIDPQFELSVSDLLDRYSTMLHDTGVVIETEYFVTCPESEVKAKLTEYDPFAHLRRPTSRSSVKKPPLTIRHPDDIYNEWDEEVRRAEELEAMEDSKDFDPFVDDFETQECYGEDGYESDGGSTLNDEDDDRDSRRNSNTFSDVGSTTDETVALNPIRPLASPIRPIATEMAIPSSRSCKCAIVQYQRSKLRPSTKSSLKFSRTSHGYRPNMSRILSSAIGHTTQAKTMVAVCANSEISRQARSTVAWVNKQFALGRCEADVDIFIEEFV